MSSASRIFFSLLLLTVIGCLGSPAAWAHRDRGPDDPCRREIGASLLHITLYQTQFDPVAEYCEEVPHAGKAFLVVDVTPDLWGMPIGVELIATNEAGQTSTILSLPTQVHERGVANAEVVLNPEVSYEVRVVLELGSDREPQSFSFPFQVAAWYKALIIPGLMVLGLIVIMAVSVVRYNVVSRREEALAEQMDAV